VADTYLDEQGVERCDDCEEEIHECCCTCETCGDSVHECACDEEE
jgi:hypothetical protein